MQGAFRDVHDALNNTAANEQVNAASERRVTALKDSLRLADLRYKNGYSSYLEVLNAQRDLFQAQASLTVLHEKRLDGHDEQLNDLAHLLISARR